ncbi:peptidase dimerization domain-containing protein [Acidithiobacillus ferrianus]
MSCNIIGIVTGALGQRWFDVSILGEEAHAGPTPIILRRDALLAAADIVAEVRAIAENYAPDSRGTVGYLEVFPNSRNVIPGKVKLSIDFRARDQETLDAMSLDLRSRCLRDEVSFNVKISLNEVVNFKPQDFNESLVNEVRASADKCGYSNQEIV